MEQRDYIMKEVEALGKMLGTMFKSLLGLKHGTNTMQGIEIANQTLQSEIDLDLNMLLSIDPDNLIDYLLTNNKGFNEDNLDKLAEILFTIAEYMPIEDSKPFLYYERSLVIYEYLDSTQKIYSLERHMRLEQIKNLLQ